MCERGIRSFTGTAAFPNTNLELWLLTSPLCPGISDTYQNVLKCKTFLTSQNHKK